MKVYVPLSDTECHCGLCMLMQTTQVGFGNALRQAAQRSTIKQVVLEHTLEQGTVSSLNIIVTIAHMVMIR